MGYLLKKLVAVLLVVLLALGGMPARFTRQAQGIALASENILAESETFGFGEGQDESRPTEIPITVSVVSATAVYDGSAHKAGAALTGGSLWGNDTLTADTTASATEATAGAIPTEVCNVTVRDDAGRDVSSGYAVTTVAGTLTVEPRALCIRGKDKQFMFDGYTRSLNEFEVSPETPLPSGFAASGVTTAGSLRQANTQADNVPNIANLKISHNAANVPLSNFIITTQPGVLRMVPANPKRAITLTANTKNWRYADMERGEPVYKLTSGALFYNQTFGGADGFPTIWEPGEKVNEAATKPLPYDKTSGSFENNDAVNYDITYQAGVIWIDPRPINITAKSESFAYDGKAHGPTPGPAGYTVQQQGNGFGLFAGHKVLSVEQSGSVTDVGSQDSRLAGAVILDANGNDVTHCYNISYISGKLTVTAAPVTIRSDDAAFSFNGSYQGKPSYTITSGALQNGETLENVNFSAQIRRNGQSVPNAFDLKSAGIRRADGSAGKLSNYKITQQVGTLTMDPASPPKHLNLHNVGGSWVYDGKPHSVPLASVNTALWSGHSVSIGGEYPSVTDVCQDVPNHPGWPPFVYDATGEGGWNIELAQQNYQITRTDGPMTVTPRPITITGANQSFCYDGTLPAPDQTAFSAQPTGVNAGLAPGHSVQSVVITGGGAAVGNYPLALSGAVIVDDSGNVVTSNYAVSYQSGSMTVTPRPVLISGTAERVKYNGNKQTASATSFMAEATGDVRGLAPGHSAKSVSVAGSGTAIGDYPTALSGAVILDAVGATVTSNYAVSYQGGTLSITQPDKGIIRMMAPATSAPYMGVETGVSNLIVLDKTALIKGDVLTTKLIGTRRDVGVTKRSVEAAITRNGVDVTDQYTIDANIGDLTITKKPITVTSASKAFDYDGQPHSEQSVTITPALPAADQLDEVLMPASILHQSSVPNAIEGLQIVSKDGGEPRTDNYKITLVTGELSLAEDRIPLTVRSLDAIKVYDGQPLAQPEYELSSGQLAEGDRLATRTCQGIQDVSQSGAPNAFDSVQVLRGELDVTERYAITQAHGTLTMTARPLKLRGQGQQFQFDGAEHAWERYDCVDGTSLAVGDTAAGIAYPAKVRSANPGKNEQRNTLDIGGLRITSAAGRDVTSSYQIEADNQNAGLLTMQPANPKRAITFKTNSLTAVYDGVEKRKTGMTLVDKATALFPGQTTPATYSGWKGATNVWDSGLNIPSAPASYPVPYDALEGDPKKPETCDGVNYDITYDYGYITVTPRLLHIQGYLKSVAFDGNVHQGGYTVSGLVPDHRVQSIDSTGMLSAPGSVTTSFANAVIVDAQGADMTRNYAITYGSGTLTITPSASPNKIKIAVRTADAAGVYDGRPLSANQFTLTSGSLRAGDRLEVREGASRIDAGTSPNACQMRVMNGSDDVTALYDVSVVAGTLTVSARPIKLVAQGQTFMFDGHTMKWEHYDFADGTSLAQGDALTGILFPNSVRSANEGQNDVQNKMVLTNARIKRADGRDATASYDIQLDDSARLHMAARSPRQPLTLGSGSMSWVYDGLPHALGGMAVDKSKGALLFNQRFGTVSQQVYATITDVGSTPNKHKYDPVPFDISEGSPDNNDAINYDLHYSHGTLTITERPITIRAVNQTAEFDGLVHSAQQGEPYYTISGGSLADGQTLKSARVSSPGVKGLGSSAVISVSDVVIVDAAGNDVTRNYAVSCAPGALTITAPQQPREITLRGASDFTVEYSGTEQMTGAVYSGISKSGELYPGDELIAFRSFLGTTVGSHPARLTARVVRDGQDVTSQYRILNEGMGNLVITKRKVTLRSMDDTLIYDGGSQSGNMPEYVTASPSLGSGDFIHEAELTGVITTEDSVPNPITEGSVRIARYNPAGGGYEDRTFCYDIRYDNANPGLLRLMGSIPLTLRVHEASKVYDGTALAPQWSLGGELAGSDALSVTLDEGPTQAGSATVSITGARVMNGQADVTRFYDMTTLSAALSVSKRPLTISGTTVSAAYDGKAHQAPPDAFAAQPEIPGAGLLAGHRVQSVQISGSRTKIGDSKTTLDGARILDGQGNDVTANYSIRYVDGLLRINDPEKRDIVATSPLVTRAYDGTEQSDDELSVDDAGLIPGDAITARVAGGGRDAGTYARSIELSIRRDGDDVTSQYNIVKQAGPLVIQPLPILVTGADAEFDYDGKPHGLAEVTIAPALAAGDELASVDMPQRIEALSPVSNSVSGLSIRTTASGKSANANYAISFAAGTLRLSAARIPVRLESASGEKIYDGQPLTAPGHQLSAGQLAAGDQLACATSGALTDVTEGGAANAFASLRILHGAVDVTSRYDVSQQLGRLSVLPREIELTAASQSFPYDGAPHALDAYQLTGGTLAAGEHLDGVTAAGSITDVGEAPNAIASGYRVLRGDGTPVPAGNYRVTLVPGTLTVTPRKIRLKPLGTSAVYDGQPHAMRGCEAQPGELAATDALDMSAVVSWPSRVDAGSTPNSIQPGEVRILRGHANVTGNYDVTILPGDPIIVEKLALEVIAPSYDALYDSLPHDLSAPEALPALPPGHEISATVTPGTAREPVQGQKNALSGVRILRGGEDVTSRNFSLTLTSGTIDVRLPEKREITIESASADKVYDGSPLAADSYTRTGDALYDSHRIEISVTGSQTLAGTSGNTIQARVLDHSGKDVTDLYYVIDKLEGALRVDKRALRVAANDAQFTYDGQDHADAGFHIAAGSLADAQAERISASVAGSIRYVGTAANAISGVAVRSDALGDVTGSYAITPVDGQLRVTPADRPITVTAPSAGKVYDGKPLSAPDVLYDQADLIGGDRLVAAARGSITDWGSAPNALTRGDVRILNGERDVTECYVVTPVPGTLIVSKRPITLSAASKSWAYDGKPHAHPVYAVSEGSLAPGDREQVAMNSAITFKGEMPNDILREDVRILRGEADATSSYELTIKPGQLKVTGSGAALTITSDSQTKEYDGEALQSPNARLTAGALAEGDRIAAQLTGAITDAGSAPNTFGGLRILHGDVDVTDAYSIKAVPGTLVVAPRPISILGGSGSFSYDGQDHAVKTYTVSGRGLAKDDERIDDASMAYSGAARYPGTVDNLPSGAMIRRGSRNISANYQIEYLPGVITIAPVSQKLALKAESASKVYDGTRLTAGYTVSGSLLPGDKLTASAKGQQTDAGASASEIDPSSVRVTNAGRDVSENYEISCESGQLSVSQRPLLIRAGSKTFAYNGSAQSFNSYAAVGLAAGDAVQSVDIQGSAVMGSAPNVASGARVRSPRADATGNYKISYENGLITIANVGKTPLTISSPSKDKPYDGKPLSAPGFSVSGNLLPGDRVQASVSAWLTQAGTAGNTIGSVSITNAGKDASEFYSVSLQPGTLTVSPRAITITAASALKEYDALPLTEPGFSLSSGTLAAGEQLSAVRVSGSQTAIGKSENVASQAQITGASGGDTSGNYQVSYVSGWLEVASRLVSYCVRYDYDGVEHESAALWGMAPLGSVIRTYRDRQLAGYRLDSVDGLPLTASLDERQNVIRVHYKTIVDEQPLQMEYYQTPLSGNNGSLNMGEGGE